MISPVEFKMAGPLTFNKAVYVLVLMLISVDFFHFSPISAATKDDFCFFLFLGWLLVGHFLYKPRNKWLTLTFKKCYWPIYLIGIAILISFISAYAIYGQSPLTSLLASRRMLSLLALPILCVCKPKARDMEKAVVCFSVILMVLSIADAVGIPVIDRSFFIDDLKPNKKLIDEDSFVMLLPGFHWVAFALFFYLDRLKRRVSVRNLIGAVFFMVSIFIIQNRTMLFAAAIPFAYTFLTIKGDKKRITVLYRLLSLVMLVVVLAVSMPQWIKLITETTMQLGSDDYNRILAYNYFLFQACPGFVYYLTGMGFISAKVSPIMQDLMASGIYNSDVGFIGFWNYHGILPIIVFFILIVKGIKKGNPYYVRFNAFLILVGSLSIACFINMDKVLWFCMFVYLLYYKPLPRIRLNNQPSNERLQ